MPGATSGAGRSSEVSWQATSPTDDAPEKGGTDWAWWYAVVAPRVCAVVLWAANGVLFGSLGTFICPREPYEVKLTLPCGLASWTVDCLWVGGQSERRLEVIFGLFAA